MKRIFVLVSFASISLAAEDLVVETLEGPITATEVAAFKRHMASAPVPGDNLRNSMVYGSGGMAVQSLGRIYEISGDRELLDRMLCFTDAMLAGRNDPEKGLVLWTGRRDPVWPNAVPAEGKRAYAGTETGDIVGHIAYAAKLILERPELGATKVPDGDPLAFGATYRERAQHYVREMDRTIDEFVMKHIVRPGSLRYYSPDSPEYVAATRPGSANRPVPWNQQTMLNHGFQRLAECHDLLDDDEERMKRYDAIVQASVDWFFEMVERIEVNGHPCYRWTYAAEKPMVHFEDSAHGGYDVGGLCRAEASGRYGVTPEMLRPFGNTVLHLMARPGHRFTARTDGTHVGDRPPGTIRGYWIDLCEYTPELLPILHEANRGRIKGSPDTAANLLRVRHRLAAKDKKPD